MSTATETAPVTIEQAFTDAVKEHSAQPEQAAVPEASTQATKPESTPTQDTAAAGASPKTADPPESTDLISETEFATLDPAKQRAELNKRWTQKTQELAAERKTLEPKRQLLDALDADPQGTVRQLAKQLGIALAPTAHETATATTTTEIVNDLTKAVQAALGPDLDFLAGPLANAFKALEPTIAARVEAAVKPVQAQTNEILSKHATAETETVMASFAAKHPDWKTHEPAMVKLGQTLNPGTAVSPLDYMESLYRLVTYDSTIQTIKESEQAAAALRLSKGAAAAETASHPIAESQVAKTPPANASIAEAFAAAKRNERWE